MRKEVKEAFWWLMPFFLVGLGTFVSLPLLSVAQLSDVARVLNLPGQTPTGLIPLSFILLYLFPLRILWVLWSWAGKDTDMAGGLKGALGFAVPLFLVGAIGLPLYLFLRLFAAAWGPA